MAANILDAERRADLAYGQGLWYAFGRLDSGQYPVEVRRRLDAFKFADAVKAERFKFETEESFTSESIQGQWDKFVASEIGE